MGSVVQRWLGWVVQGWLEWVVRWWLAWVCGGGWGVVQEVVEGGLEDQWLLGKPRLTCDSDGFGQRVVTTLDRV